jgi:hypothetical protein
MPIAGGGGGGGGNTTAQVVASGKVLPVAAPTGVTVDTTTYDDTIKGSGKLTTLVFPADQGALAIAIAGDPFPRWLFPADAHNGLYFGDGSFDPTASGTGIVASAVAGGPMLIQGNGRVVIGNATDVNHAVAMRQVSTRFTITAGALPTVQLVSATGAQLLTTRDVEAHTPVTFNPGVATTATCTVALSPDNVTYSALAVITKPVGTVFDGEIDDVVVSVPANWYLRLTVNAQAALGLTTYY